MGLAGLLCLSVAACAPHQELAPLAPRPVPAPKPGAAVFSRTGSSVFPASWLEPPVSVRVEDLTPETADRAERIIEAVVKTYPVGFFEKSPVEVYLFSHMRYYGKESGGTQIGRQVFLTFRADDPDGTTGLEARFYREHAAVVLRDFHAKFPAAQWRALNPPGFTYWAESDHARAAGRVTAEWRPRDMREGFLSDYARSDIETDAKLIAAELFLNKTVFTMARRIYPQIDAKARLMTEFYHDVDPRFSAEFFAARPNAPGALPLSFMDMLNAAEAAKQQH